MKRTESCSSSPQQNILGYDGNSRPRVGVVTTCSNMDGFHSSSYASQIFPHCSTISPAESPASYEKNRTRLSLDVFVQGVERLRIGPFAEEQSTMLQSIGCIQSAGPDQSKRSVLPPWSLRAA